MILDIIIFIAVLAVLVLVHEFGHFIAARKSGMLVEEFGFGFPPRLFSWKKGETVWSINAIPFGGFVKIAGENGGDEENKVVGEQMTVDGQDVTVIRETKEEVFVNGEEISEKEEVIIETSSNAGRFFSDKSATKRAMVLIAGVFMNFLLGWVLISAVMIIGTEKSLVISQVAERSPAQEVGLNAGDVILGYESMDEFVNYISDNKGKEIEFNVKHNGNNEVIKVTPREDPPEGEGSLGVALAFGGVESLPFFEAIWEGLKNAVAIFGMIYVMLFKLIINIFNGGAMFKQVSGPIGIFQATSQAVGLGWVYLVNLVALISLNLAAINIFPFPALDGGRVIVIAIEKIIRRPISLKIQQVVNGVGFALLMVLIVLATFQDIKRLF